MPRLTKRVISGENLCFATVLLISTALGNVLLPLGLSAKLVYQHTSTCTGKNGSPLNATSGIRRGPLDDF